MPLGSRCSSPAELSSEALKNEAGIFRVEIQLGQEALTRFLSSSQCGFFTSIAAVGEVADELIVAATDSQTPALK